MKIMYNSFKLNTKTIHILFCLCLAFFSFSGIFAEQKDYILGGEQGWPSFSVNENITYGKGRFGYTSVELSKNVRKIGETTDLLLNFEGTTVRDACENYTIVKNDMLRMENSVMGHYCGLSRGNGKGITLKGKNGTVFGTEGTLGTFAIEFWLNPSIAENGEIIFHWNSSRTVNDRILYQMIQAGFVNSRIEWSFRNIFEGYTKTHGEIRLQSHSTVVPDKWAHHVLVFDEETGLLEYSIDGKTEDVKYLTVSGHERGTIYQPSLGIPNEITICPSFTGSIDDFRILQLLPSENSLENNGRSTRQTESLETLLQTNYDFYKVTGGRFETQPIHLVPGAKIEKIDTIEYIPSQTEIRYYARVGENFYNWTDTYPEWHRVIPGIEIENLEGRFFQLAAELYPDGGGNKTPSITEIKITYNEPPLPLAPTKVKAQAGDGYVDLSWNYSLDDTTDGYYVYYGLRPGEYLGIDSSNGSSPINVGDVNSFRINGLRNGAIYYFAVVAYSKLDQRIIGNFSNEVFARPSRARN